MDWRLVLKMPISVDEIPEGSRGVHESVLRSYWVLIFVHWLLSEGCPGEVVRHFIEEAGYHP